MNFGDHTKIAFELSGGKDSVACLYLLREHLDRITVYWLNTGDAYPDTLRVIGQCREMCPNFVEIRSDVIAWRSKHGFPTDVIPASGNDLGVLDGLHCVDRYVCCAANIMNPMHERVLQDGNTLIIRGQKKCDTHKGPLVSGDWADGVQLMFPIEDWDDDRVMVFLREVGAPIHGCYEFGPEGVDCMHCTGWWEKTPMEYLAKFPMAHDYVTGVRELVRTVVMHRMQQC